MSSLGGFGREVVASDALRDATVFHGPRHRFVRDGGMQAPRKELALRAVGVLAQLEQGEGQPTSPLPQLVDG